MAPAGCRHPPRHLERNERSPRAAPDRIRANGEQHRLRREFLYERLDGIGPQLPVEVKNGQLQLVVRVSASDGSVTVLSPGEIDLSFGNSPVLLGWDQDGEALSALRLVALGDVHRGRYVAEGITIGVLALPA